MAEVKEKLTDLVPGVENEIVVLLIDIENCIAKDGSAYQRLKVRDTHNNSLDVTAWDNARLNTTVITIPVIMRMLISAQKGRGVNAGRTFYNLIAAQYCEGDKTQFLPKARIDRKAVFKEITSVVNNLKAPLNGICAEIIKNNKVRFTEYPMSQDEGYDVRSGIMEATYNLIKSVEPMIALYGLDRDLTLAGAVLYNIGNCFAVNAKYQNTTDDVLLGPGVLAFEEICKTVTLLKERYADNPQMTEVLNSEYIRMLEHIVLCNDRDIKGAIPEALVLNHINEMSNTVDIAKDSIIGKDAGTYVVQNSMYQKRPYRLYVKQTQELAKESPNEQK